MNGYYCVVGNRVLKWYTEPEKVEYLFGLGQLRLIGAPGSELGVHSFMTTHEFIIKVPLELVANNLDDSGYE